MNNVPSVISYNHTRHPITSEEWLYNKEYSTESKVVYQGYDANMMPLPDLSTIQDNDYTRAYKAGLISKVLEVTKGFKGEVWLDDVCIKEISK